MEMFKQDTKIKKEQLKKIFDGILENYDNYEFDFSIEPEIMEMIGWDGKGKRFTKYIRTITIIDKEPKEQNIDKWMW